MGDEEEGVGEGFAPLGGNGSTEGTAFESAGEVGRLGMDGRGLGSLGRPTESHRLDKHAKFSEKEEYLLGNPSGSFEALLPLPLVDPVVPVIPVSPVLPVLPVLSLPPAGGLDCVVVDEDVLSGEEPEGGSPGRRELS